MCFSFETLINMYNLNICQRNYSKFNIIKYEGVCIFKNKKRNCPGKNTYLINNEICVCDLHLNKHEKRVIDIIKFNKKFNKYIKNLFLYQNDNYNFIETLKDIILLMNNHKKYKYTLENYFNFVNCYIDNFDIQDEEYSSLIDYYLYV